MVERRKGDSRGGGQREKKVAGRVGEGLMIEGRKRNAETNFKCGKMVERRKISGKVGKGGMRKGVFGVGRKSMKEVG